MRIILSGAAPLASHVEEYLRIVTGSHVLQGYGNFLYRMKFTYWHPIFSFLFLFFVEMSLV